MNLRQKLKRAIAGYRIEGTVREQVEALLASLKRLIIGNSASALFTASIFLGSPQAAYARNWCVGVMISLMATTVLAGRIRKTFASQADAERVAYRLVAMAAFRALFWGAGFATLFPLSSASQGYLLGYVAFGMMIGGVFAYWSLPTAALAFSSILYSGAIAGLALSDLEWRHAFIVALSIAFLFFNRLALAHAAALRQHVETAGHLRAEREVVSLLLRDYEDSSKDWLWQTDANGLLTRGHLGFGNAIAGLPRDLGNLPLVKALGESAHGGEQRAGLAVLQQALSDTTPFSDIEIIIGEGQEAVHLSLSAKPQLGRKGELLGWHGVASNISAERKAEARVRHLAHFDSLTGLPNRAQLRNQLEARLERPGSVPAWLCYADLDGFKHVNDTLGHAAGDDVLCELAKRFTSLLRPGEMVARIGGDEFVFVLERDAASIDTAWQALVARASQPVMVQGQPLVVGASFGITPLDGKMANVDELLRRADLALYNAKQQGKGTARYYQNAMDEVLIQRRAMERELRAAIAAKNFEIHYQPIYSCNTGGLKAYEALLRWNHPALGPISPATFMPIAEDCGLITEIGGWVLRQACRDAKSFPPGVGVSVNISAIQLRSRRLLADVTRALEESQLPPSRLELEMTESALMENVEFAKSMIDNLKTLGVGVALDDFGTGYSSLAYLHSFRFDRIKIDRSFVQAYDQRNESRAVVDAVVMIARQLGIGITAEGIETVEQYKAMVERGCDLAQGFLLGRPAPLGSHRDEGKAKPAIAIA